MGKVFAQKKPMLSNIAVVVILKPEIIDDLEDEGKVKEGVIQAVILFSHGVLNRSINSKQVERFDQKIDQD